MEDNNQLSLKRVVNIKSVVTPRWKEDFQQQLQQQVEQVDVQLQQLDMQGQRAISELQKTGLQPPGPQMVQQIENIQSQVNQSKGDLLNQKNQMLQQLQQIQLLELGQEVVTGQMESMFNLRVGDNLVLKTNVDILLRDGLVEEIRGEI